MLNTFALAVGFGAVTAILWEFGEYFAFIRDSPELDTAYTDTLGDLALGLTGSTVAAFVTAGSPAPPMIPPMRGMKPEDVYALKGVSDPRLSPDGTTVAYVPWSIDGEANEYRGEHLARAGRRLRAAAPVHDRRAPGRRAALVARRQQPGVRLEPRREGARPALRDLRCAAARRRS